MGLQGFVRFLSRGARLLSAATVLVLVAAVWTNTSTAAEPTPASKQEKSADEVARELANPNASLAKLTFKNQFRWYTGDLPHADDQFNYTLLFQPEWLISLNITPVVPNVIEGWIKGRRE